MAVLKVNHLTGLGLQQARLIPPGERGQTAYPGIAGQSIPPQGGLVPRWGWSRGAGLCGHGRSSGTFA